MSDLLDLARQQLQGDTINSLSQSIGATPDQTQQAIGAILPSLLGGLARNASNPEGEEQLHNALQRDHDGSLLDHLGGLFGGSQAPPVSEKTTQGGAILDHILGNKRQRVETGVSQSSGLSSGQVMKLMAMLAPLLMGILGKKSQQSELSPGGLGELLRDESQQVESSAGGGLLSRMLDQDGDGDLDMMDMMKFGAGKLFG